MNLMYPISGNSISNTGNRDFYQRIFPLMTVLFFSAFRISADSLCRLNAFRIFFAGINNCSVAGLHQPKQPTHLHLK